MKIFCPEYILWENGEIYSGYLVFVQDSGKIKKLLPLDKISGKQRKEITHLKGLLIPGLVNAHCHLELAWMRGEIDAVEGIEEFFAYMRGIHTKRPSEINILEKLTDSISEMYAGGINACADISNTGISFLPKEHSKIQFHTFVEVFEKEGKSREDILHTAEHLMQKFIDSDRHTASLSLHTLFTSSRALMYNVANQIVAQNKLHSIHFMESREEKMFFTEGRPMQNIHEKLKVEFSSNRPAGIAAEVLPKEQRILFVHNTYASERDIIEIIEHFNDPWFCFCPASNEFISKEIPDINAFIKHSENLVLGTDSYASNSKLNIFAEMQIILNHFPNLEIGDLLKMASINGARLLKIDKHFGSISPGKTPGLIQIRDYSPERKDILFKEIIRLF
jgi:cytosine/adenosine deaminase-related metal-dependent hydrolase